MSDEKSSKWSMGLRGYWAQIANLTAVGLICLLLYQSQKEQFINAKNDRQMFREELKSREDIVERRFERMLAAVEGNSQAIRQNEQHIITLIKAVNTNLQMSQECMREIRDMRKKAEKMTSREIIPPPTVMQ